VRVDWIRIPRVAEQGGSPFEREAEVRLLFLLLHVGRDQRGAVAATFAITALTFFGLVGFATEVGSWYVVHPKAENAAVMAVAITVSASFNSCATKAVQTNRRNTATTVASLKDFSTAVADTVAADCPPPSHSAHVGDNSAVQAVISQNQTILFARLLNIRRKPLSRARSQRSSSRAMHAF